MTTLAETLQHADADEGSRSRRSIRRAVRMYVCGPTVYDFAHIGNARPVDRVRRAVSPAAAASTARAHVVYARNITDVDDKINARAARDFPDLPLNAAIAARHRGDRAPVPRGRRGARLPAADPRAARDRAYRRDDGADRAAGRRAASPMSPRTTCCSRRARWTRCPARRATARWRAARSTRCSPARGSTSRPTSATRWISCCGSPRSPSEPGWPSPCGIATPGRPGWHIECSAMSMATLLAPVRRRPRLRRSRQERLRHPRRRHRSRVSPPRERNRAVVLRLRRARAWPMSGCTTASCRSKARRCRRASAISSPSTTCCARDAFGGRAWPGEALRLAMLRTPLPPADRLDGRGAGGGREARSTAGTTAIARRRAARDVAPSAERRARRRSQHAGRARATASRWRARRRAATATATRQSARPADIRRATSARPPALASGARSTARAVEALVAERARRPRGEGLGGIRPAARRARRSGVALKDSKDGTTWEIKR